MVLSHGPFCELRGGHACGLELSLVSLTLHGWKAIHAEAVEAQCATFMGDVEQRQGSGSTGGAGAANATGLPNARQRGLYHHVRALCESDDLHRRRCLLPAALSQLQRRGTSAQVPWSILRGLHRRGDGCRRGARGNAPRDDFLDAKIQRTTLGFGWGLFFQHHCNRLARLLFARSLPTGLPLLKHWRHRVFPAAHWIDPGQLQHCLRAGDSRARELLYPDRL
mmetsp:Transcript_42079/g.98093  ORF Transcript_42079/g.98093 Transcript_42079/m.98093 type:complete len:223 (+) Transcript_42079:312-980(+)